MIYLRLKRVMFLSAMVAVALAAWPAASAAQESQPVLAQVGDDSITRAYLEARIDRLGPQMRAHYESPQGQLELLKQLIRIDVFSRRAKELGMDSDPSFRARLEAVEKTLLAADYALQVAGGVSVSEADARSYYDQHLDQYGVSEQINAPSIVIKIPAGASSEEIVEREARINEARARALRGEPFPELVKEYTENFYAGNDDFFGRGRLAPEVAEKVFALREGEVSPVMRGNDAFLLFKLGARRAAYRKPYEEVREQIVTELKEQHKYEDLTAEEGLLYRKYGVVMVGQESTAAPGETTITGPIVELRPVEESRRGGSVLGWITVATRSPAVGPTVVVTVRESTELRRDGAGQEIMSFAELNTGQDVVVGIVGPVAPTAPPRVDAGTITVLAGGANGDN